MKIFSQPYRRKTDRMIVSLNRMNGLYQLEIDALHDAPEILYRLAAVLYVHDWNIVHSDISTADNTVKDRFQVRPAGERRDVDDLKFERMMQDLELVLFERPSVVEFIRGRDKAVDFKQSGKCQVEFVLDSSRTRVMVNAQDRPGLLLCQAQVFSLLGLDIQQAVIHTEAGGRVRNVFTIAPTEQRLKDIRFRERLSDALRVLL